MWEKVKGIDNDRLMWGDEIEYGVLALDEQAGTVRCSLRGAEILATLKRNEQPLMDAESGTAESSCNWVPEYGSWMVESTPRRSERSRSIWRARPKPRRRCRLSSPRCTIIRRAHSCSNRRCPPPSRIICK